MGQTSILKPAEALPCWQPVHKGTLIPCDCCWRKVLQLTWKRNQVDNTSRSTRDGLDICASHPLLHRQYSPICSNQAAPPSSSAGFASERSKPAACQRLRSYPAGFGSGTDDLAWAPLTWLGLETHWMTGAMCSLFDSTVLAFHYFAVSNCFDTIFVQLKLSSAGPG